MALVPLWFSVDNMLEITFKSVELGGRSCCWVNAFYVKNLKGDNAAQS